MWTHKKLKYSYVGDQEWNKNTKKYDLVLKRKNMLGKTVGKTYPFSNVYAAKKAGWTYTK